ncbi:MAG TPA: phosphohistidine phosphatase SixA [Terriglobales bacterium]|jgi:phosphohistidine phosphatase|nr:phosphohistidine phosphatase SixA [Terriglobales bacterium]
MIIYFVRHASAGQKKATPKKDEKRPLDAEGVHQCTQMGRILSAMEVTVDAVISSPLKRATQTAALVANEIGYEGKLHLENSLRPEAKYDHFRDMLHKYVKAEALMVVGHNPNFSEFLARTIAANGARAYVDMKKGAVAKVESTQKKFVLHWLLTPRLAKASADAGVNENSKSQAALSQNGAGGELDIPAEYVRQKSTNKKQAQADLTTKSRPKTSRK